MQTYQRTLSDSERRRLQGKLPWFGPRRRDLLTDIGQGLIDVYEFDVLRSWDINGCCPPCCPYTYLFQTVEDLYVYVETWQEFDRKESRVRVLIIESTPTTRMLLKSTLPEALALHHDAKIRDWNEFFEIKGDAEWRSWTKHEIPPELIELLET